jgi:hypothetical protein
MRDRTRDRQRWRRAWSTRADADKAVEERYRGLLKATRCLYSAAEWRTLERKAKEVRK